MSLPPDLTRMSPEDVITLLGLHVFEVNLLIRYLALTGKRVQADVVDRDDAIYHARPEIIVNVQ